MEKDIFNEWNSLVYFISDVYGATKKLKVGEAGIFAQKIRKTAISLSASVNSFPKTKNDNFSKIYSILSSISVLETYLIMAKRERFIRDTSELENKLSDVKDDLYQILGQK